MVRWVSSEQRRVVSLKTDMFTGEQQGGDNVLHFFSFSKCFSTTGNLINYFLGFPGHTGK